MKFWKADKVTSAKIIELMKQRQAVFAKARKMAKRLGADPKKVYYSDSPFGVTTVSGFVFEVPPPTNQWIRLKGTNDGWCPRSRSETHTEMHELKSNAIGQICDLLGLEMISPQLTSNVPGIHPVGDVVYLQTRHGDPKGCKRITDIVFERATAQKKKANAK